MPLAALTSLMIFTVRAPRFLAFVIAFGWLLAASTPALAGPPEEERERLFAIPILPGSLNFTLVELNPETGQEILSWTTDIFNAGQAGLAYDGATLWMVGRDFTVVNFPYILWRFAPGVSEPLASWVIEGTGLSSSITDIGYVDGFLYMVEGGAGDLLVFDIDNEEFLPALDVDEINMTEDGTIRIAAGLTGVAQEEELRAQAQDEESSSIGVAILETNGSASSFFETDQFLLTLACIDDEIYAYSPENFQAPRMDVFTLNGSLLRAVSLPYQLTALGADGVPQLPEPELLSGAILENGPGAFDLELAFSVPMDNERAQIVENYAISGAGQGTLADHPDSVSPGNSRGNAGFAHYRLRWNSGAPDFESGPLVVTATGLYSEDLVAIGSENSVQVTEDAGLAGIIVK